MASFINVVLSGRPAFKAGNGDIVTDETTSGGRSVTVQEEIKVSKWRGRWYITRTTSSVDSSEGCGPKSVSVTIESWPIKGHTLTDRSLCPPPAGTEIGDEYSSQTYRGSVR